MQGADGSLSVATEEAVEPGAGSTGAGADADADSGGTAAADRDAVAGVPDPPVKEADRLNPAPGLRLVKGLPAVQGVLRRREP